MKIDNKTPLVAAAVPMQAAGNRNILTVIAKAVYSVDADGGLSLSSKQSQLAYGDTFYDEDPMLGTYYESDIVPFKPRADVVVVGNAIAPAGNPANVLEVSLTVGDLSKRVLVVGDRQWLTDKGMPPIASKPTTFTEMSLSYANAFGGVDEASGAVNLSNPIGKGILAEQTKKLLADVPLPNLESPDQPIKFWKDQPEPTSLGFLGKGWPPRVELLGTYDEAWQENVCPAPPADFSSDFYNGAPRDQQVDGYLIGDEVVEVTNMQVDGTFQFQLPGLRPVAVVTKGPMPTAEQIADPEKLPAAGEQQIEAFGLKLDTLVIEPNVRQATLVWRGFCFIEGLTAEEVRAISLDWATD